MKDCMGVYLYYVWTPGENPIFITGPKTAVFQSQVVPIFLLET